MDKDNWDIDPQIKYLREIFGNTEREQTEFLNHTGISPFDERLRLWREKTLTLFEKIWMLSSTRGIVWKKDEIPKIYLHCLALFLSMDKIKIPSELLHADENIDHLIEEVLK